MCIIFCYFDFVEGTPTRQNERNTFFFRFCTRLFVPLCLHFRPKEQNYRKGETNMHSVPETVCSRRSNAKSGKLLRRCAGDDRSNPVYEDDEWR